METSKDHEQASVNSTPTLNLKELAVLIIGIVFLWTVMFFVT